MLILSNEGKILFDLDTVGIVKVELTGRLPDRVPDISLKPKDEIFPYSTEVSAAGVPIARNIDTEYKILTEIATKLGNNNKAKGVVRLFTERPPCNSCSNVIDLFSKKYPLIDVEIIHNKGVMLINF
ncbi:deaminase domain-containing protein [Aquimarina algicola]|uniref:deaminase domain-containing protein n=1 Tax=Aquimarina algicola TaxID=2589995 RepID=UPI001CF453BF|nr:deaminase domain-containing protein [Aquimarina algicola]